MHKYSLSKKALNKVRVMTVGLLFVLSLAYLALFICMVIWEPV